MECQKVLTLIFKLIFLEDISLIKDQMSATMPERFAGCYNGGQARPALPGTHHAKAVSTSHSSLSS